MNEKTCETPGCKTKPRYHSKCYKCRTKSKSMAAYEHNKKSGGFAAPKKIKVSCMNEGDGHRHDKMDVLVSSEYKGTPRKICHRCIVRADNIGIEFLNAPKHAVGVFV